MQTLRQLPIILVLLITGSIEYFVPDAHGATRIYANGRAVIAVGAGRTTAVGRIEFTVPGANVGDGTRIYGFENGTTSSVLVRAFARAPAGGRLVFWTVNSSQPLQCATPASCGATSIPMTEIGWESISGTEIANATFTGAANQPLLTFPTSRYIYVWHRFYFVNNTTYPAGDYKSRVVYTVSMP